MSPAGSGAALAALVLASWACGGGERGFDRSAGATGGAIGPAVPVATPPGALATAPASATGAGGACAAAPAGADAAGIAVHEAVNALRLAMGVPCQDQIEPLNIAARRHCDYYSANTGSCVANPHAELPGCALYVAATFSERAAAAGYTMSEGFENMAFVGGPAALTGWIDSVWHRTPLLSPWLTHHGYGRAGKCDTMDFAGGPSPAADDAIATYPFDGQSGVPTSFAGREAPAPPSPPGGFPSGYPIHVFVRETSFSVHTLRRAGDAVDIPHVWIGPDDSELLSDAYVMYAHDPLALGTTYEVALTGTRGGGAVTVELRFTTAERSPG